MLVRSLNLVQSIGLFVLYFDNISAFIHIRFELSSIFTNTNKCKAILGFDTSRILLYDNLTTLYFENGLHHGIRTIRKIVKAGGI